MKLAAARGYGVAGCSEFTVDGELRAGTLGLVPLLWMECGGWAGSGNSGEGFPEILTGPRDGDSGPGLRSSGAWRVRWNAPQSSAQVGR